jgi:hypothetical protein
LACLHRLGPGDTSDCAVAVAAGFMRNVLKLTTVMALAAIALLLSTDRGAAATFQLSGPVTDQVGNPIAETVIAVVDANDGSVVSQSTTEANGEYALQVEAGVYHLEVTPRLLWVYVPRLFATLRSAPTSCWTLFWCLPIT